MYNTVQNCGGSLLETVCDSIWSNILVHMIRSLKSSLIYCTVIEVCSFLLNFDFLFLCNCAIKINDIIYLFFYSDSPLDSKIKTNMMCDVFSLSGKYIPVSYTCIIKFEYAENNNNAVRVIPL